MPDHRPLRSRLLSGLGLLTIPALLLTACSSPTEQEIEEAEASPEDVEAFAPFYEQEPEWETCEGTMLCAEIEVPLDYEDPEGETIEIQAISSNTAPESGEHLLTNPGGPGSSGYDTVAEDLEFIFSEELIDAYNVVGFDPRGVHRSAPVECLTDEEMDENRERVAEGEEELDDEAAVEQAREDAQWLADRCEDRTGESLGHVDTVSAARDMDILRAALGEEELNYLGFSYGTKLGMTYAEHHPEHVGRFVLDGVLDVSVDSHELQLAQARGFESALEDYAQWCVDQDECPVQGEPEDVIAAVQDLFAQVAEEPVEGHDGRTVPIGVLVSGFILPMYDPEGWGYLNEGLAYALEEGDFYAFQHWADQSAGREPDGSYDWKSQMAFRAIMCLDYPVSDDPEVIDEEYDETVEMAPTFGPYLGHSGIACAEWPHSPVTEPFEPTVEDMDEMLLIGTTGDPATPAEWAENTHEMVPASSLLVYEGEGHLAYRPDNDCVVELVDAYLLDGELFEGREEC